MILRAMSNHSINVDVQSQCLATLSSIGLRQPENCQAIVSKHGVPLILTAMQRLPNAVNVQRSACLVLRNLVSRNKEHVDVILGCGAEDLCRAARQRHPACNVSFFLVDCFLFFYLLDLIPFFLFFSFLFFVFVFLLFRMWLLLL